MAKANKAQELINLSIELDQLATNAPESLALEIRKEAFGYRTLYLDVTNKVAGAKKTLNGMDFDKILADRKAQVAN